MIRLPRFTHLRSRRVCWLFTGAFLLGLSFVVFANLLIVHAKYLSTMPRLHSGLSCAFTSSQLPLQLFVLYLMRGVLIIGAASGLGRDFAEAMSRQSAPLFLNHRNY